MNSPALGRLQVLHRLLDKPAHRFIFSRYFQTSRNSSVDARISVSPNPSQIDDPVLIRAQGLPPASPVTLTVEVKVDEDNLHFKSRNYYHTSLEGSLNSEHMIALEGGSYEGEEKMGPFTSMRRVGDQSSLSFLTSDVTKSLVFNVQLWLGHREEGATRKRDPILLAETKALRRFMAPNVQRIPIKEGRVRGTLFVPTKSEV